MGTHKPISYLEIDESRRCELETTIKILFYYEKVKHNVDFKEAELELMVTIYHFFKDSIFSTKELRSKTFSGPTLNSYANHLVEVGFLDKVDFGKWRLNPKTQEIIQKIINNLKNSLYKY